jgi:2-aminobenzoylacetyl-CoA thioesterase
MTQKKHKPIAITPNFFQLGTPAYPAYLSLGDEGMIIEGGISATFNDIVEQVTELGIPPERIKYLAITHTHPDHVGAVPHLKKVWPHLKTFSGQVAASMLKSEDMMKEVVRVDNVITEILMIKGEIEVWPPDLVNPSFDIDPVVKEGDKINLGRGVEWTVYETPGHSSCHISLYDQKDDIVIIGDATGLFNPEKNLFWPNYFDSLEKYCNSIKKLYNLPAKVGALSHNGVIKGQVKNHFHKAMLATESYHFDMLKRLNEGEDPKQIAFETARRIYTFTNMQPFEVIHGLSRLMMKRSQAAAGKDNLFKLQ